MPDLSDKIIHICVPNEGEKCNYDVNVYTFASSRAQISIWKHLHLKMPLQVVKYISDHWDSVTFGSVTRVLFEAASLEILRWGGTFTRKRVWEESPSKASAPVLAPAPNLLLGELGSFYFDDLQQLENMKPSTCYKPTSRNFESVDAVISPDSRPDVSKLVQIFKWKAGQNHGYKLQGLKNMDGVLKSDKYELLSCVPLEYYQ